MPEVWQFVNRSHQSTGQMMLDICDGQYFRTHPLFSRNRKALQLIINNDDIEIVNPIGSHTKKHKLSIFYYTLGNIPPEFRSGLHAIQLLCVSRSADLKMGGLHLLMSDFILTVNQLSSTGVSVMVNGNHVLLEGALVMASCDTLAAHSMGGFKEGVGFAYKACRVCMGNKQEIKTLFSEKEFALRDEDEHRVRSARLETLAPAEKAYWSKMWGINALSWLQSVDGFPICTGLVQDPMHLLLEGVVPYVLKLVLLNFVIVEKHFTLDWLNQRIQSFPYTYLEKKSKPEIIDKAHISDDGKLRQTSAGMFTLCLILPYILAGKIPENNEIWLNFMRLVQITLLATSPSGTGTTASVLSQLICDHHQNFISLFPRASVIPKMHYMVHLPSQLLKYGPLRHHWCMRFEAKHAYFKNQKWRNFKNLPLSISTKHQKYMCFKQSGKNGAPAENFLYVGDIVKSNNELIQLDVEYPGLVVIGIDTSMVYRAKELIIHGHCYRPGCAVVLDYIDSLPQFAIVKDIVVIQDVKYFVVEPMKTQSFAFHAVAYILDRTRTMCLVRHEDLFSRWPLNIHRLHGEKSVINKYSHIGEYF